MAFELMRDDESITISSGHWSVYLLIAQAFGWKPVGTQAPTNYNNSEPWHGQYDTNDGQTVIETDAKQFAEVLHAAVVSEHINIALSDMIKRVEKQAEDAGLTIPNGMHMKNKDFYDEFSPLLMFLYKGTFVIF